MRPFIILMLALLTTHVAFGRELYVSPDGDDSLTRESNNINSPWKTLGHAIYNLKAGDTLLVRRGVYTPLFPLILRSDYASKTYGGNPQEEMNAESGTADSPITVMPEKGHSVVIDLRNLNTFIQLDDKSHWHFKGLHFVNATKVFAVGENSLSTHNLFEDLDIRVANGGDNYAPIQLINGNSENTIIRRNRIVGPGKYSELHQNTAGIYLKAIKNVVIEYNEIENFPIGIYYKHRTVYTNPDEINISIRYNLIENTSRSAMDLNCDYADIEYNILGSNNSWISLNNANGSPGGDYNKIRFNTFYSGGLKLNHNTQSGDPIPGAIGNEVFGNIFNGSPLKLHEYSDLAHNTKLDFNVYGGVDAAIVENRVQYSLNSWRAKNGGDLNSVAGTVRFNSMIQGRDLRKYNLSSGSVGYGLVYDGIQLGSKAVDIGLRGLAPEN